MKEYILLTGASSGIGLEMARDLAAKNHHLILVARNEEKLETLRKELMKDYQIDVFCFV